MTTANEIAGADAASGTVCVCGAGDVEKLAELYYETFPWATPAEINADIADDGRTWWKGFKDSHGEIRAAIMARLDGSVIPYVNPEEADSALIREALVLLAQDVRAQFAKAGITQLAIVFPSSLRELGDSLEQAGYVGREIFQIRYLHFSPSGKLQRTS